MTRASTGSGAGRRSRRAARVRSAVRVDPGLTVTAQGVATEPPTRPGPALAPDPPQVADHSPAARPNFAHASEAEMARILDFYQVRWEYEPHVFPVVWNLEGAVIESFAPDFWLPDLDLYLEMTTLRQKLVRKKNRKLRRVLELYPDLRVKLFYARDFRALMLKFGKLGLVAELSGTSGQVVPVRPDGDVAAAIELPIELSVAPDPSMSEEPSKP
jgi:hypoxanthine phosphoribosyltransferase